MSKNHEASRAGLLHAFIEAHPGGWSHHDWERLLGELRGRGLLAVGGEAEIGAQIERAYLERVVSSFAIPGLGPKRRGAVVDHYGRLWELRQASAEEVAALPGMTRPVAEALVAVLR